MYSQVFLYRLRQNKDEGTYGALIVGGRPRFVTLEPSWFNNQPFISCIPPGTYTCLEHESPKFGSTYLVTNVPHRSDILFHWGNWITNTEGCILVGSGYNPDLGMAGILNSRIAFNKFMNLLKNIKQFQLTIRDFTTADT